MMDGYLPAELPWARVIASTEQQKAKLDLLLEQVSHSVVGRFTPYCAAGVDLFRRFRSYGFPDVGDYDVLAYWPQINTWLMVESKNNQPPFCLKDAKRLREKIFGRQDKDRGHMGKIDKRYQLLLERHVDVCQLLGWPQPNQTTSPRVVSLYVSKELSWWMRNTPYETATTFLRIDMLDPWLRNNIGVIESGR